jgi:hypothetical protein
MYRLALAIVAFSRVAAAEVRAVDHNPAAELAVIAGGIFPLGGYIEPRLCVVTARPFIGCVHAAIGKQHDESIFDVAGTAGVRVRSGSIDFTASGGVSILPPILLIGDAFLYPFDIARPAGDGITYFPFTANAGVSVGYYLVEDGRFRVRAEVGMRGWLRLSEASKYELVTPHGIAGTIGIGAAY